MAAAVDQMDHLDHFGGVEITYETRSRIGAAPATHHTAATRVYLSKWSNWSKWSRGFSPRKINTAAPPEVPQA